MLLRVEGKRVHELEHGICSRQQRQKFSKCIGDDGDEDQRYIDSLWFEVVDFLED